MYTSIDIFIFQKISKGLWAIIHNTLLPERRSMEDRYNAM